MTVSGSQGASLERWPLLDRVANFNSRRRDAWMQRQAATIAAGSTVLDVGAGTCPYRPLFSHCKYVSQDFGQLPADELRGKQGYGRIDIVSDVLAIPLPCHSMDVVVCTEVLEHVPDPAGAVKEMTRLLRPGGTLLLSAPLGSGIHQAPYHFYGGFTPYWYRSILGALGYDTIETIPNGGSFLHYAQESLRFGAATKPWRLPAPAWVRILWFPLWVLLAPILLGVAPLAAAALDRFDVQREFTVGYLVTATKGSPSPPDSSSNEPT